MTKPRVVIFLGEDVLPMEEEFFEARKIVARKIGAEIAKFAKKYEIVLAYQTALKEEENIFREAEKAAMDANLAVPFDVEKAGEQGKNGFIFEQALQNVLAKEKQDKKVVTVITQSVVEKELASKNLVRPVGRIYLEKEALKLIKMKKWQMREVERGKYRRFLPVVKPVDVVEKRAIDDLLTAGEIVVVESGSIPVYRTKVLKTVKSFEAVVEGDFAAEKLAELLRADIFVSVMAKTGVCVRTEFDTEISLRELTAKEARGYLESRQFASEITAAKIEAHIKFAKRQKASVLCGISNLEEAIKGKSGTNII